MLTNYYKSGSNIIDHCLGQQYLNLSGLFYSHEILVSFYFERSGIVTSPTSRFFIWRKMSKSEGGILLVELRKLKILHKMSKTEGKQYFKSHSARILQGKFFQEQRLWTSIMHTQPFPSFAAHGFFEEKCAPCEES